jgi:hypothetical protein
MCGVVVLLATALGGCGGAETRAEEAEMPEEAAPPTDRDPPTHTPRPAARGHTGDISSVATAGGYDQAKSVAVRFILAMRDGDEPTLTALLADPLGRALPRVATPNRQRSAVVRELVSARQRTNLGSEAPLESLIDPATLEVQPLSRHQAGRALPSGFSGSDLVVSFLLAAQGRQHFRAHLGWTAHGVLVIRTGSEPQILAL